MIYVIGDIHGNKEKYDAIKDLLEMVLIVILLCLCR